MPSMSEMFPSKWLAAGDLDGRDLDVTIKDCTFESVGASDRKWVLWFDGVEKGMILNVTRSKTIGQLLMSDETDDWIGKRITLYPTETMYNKEMVPTIGVRKKLPKSRAQPSRQAAPAGKPARPMTQAEVDDPDAELDDDDLPF